MEATPDLGSMLRHYDPPQLFFQLAEIVDERSYLQHGIEVSAGDVIFDVGANVGVAAAFFAAHCKAGVVHSFEPIPAVYSHLVENVEAFPACVTHPFGLGAADASVEMTFYPRAAAMSGAYADPRAIAPGYGPTCSLRAVGRGRGRASPGTPRRRDGERGASHPLLCSQGRGVEHVDLLKIDVERAEADVIRGIDEGDWSSIRQLVVEAHEEPGRIEAMTAELEGRGYGVIVNQERAWRGTGVRMIYARRPR